MSELELKLTVTADTLKRLRDQDPPLAYRCETLDIKRLRTIYYDSKKRHFLEAGTAIRLRQAAELWFQTVKSGRKLHCGLSRTEEFECAVSGQALEPEKIPEDMLEPSLRKLLRKEKVSPLFETNVVRTATLYNSPEGDEIEVAFDIGDAIADNSKVPLNEIELELITGKPEALFALAKILVKDQAFLFSSMSKAEIGYRLSEGTKPPSHSDFQPALPIKLKQKWNAEDAFQAVLRSCLQQIIVNRYAVLFSDASEPVHQFRVGIRRLRSALRLFRPIMRKQTFQLLEQPAKHLAKLAGDLRDLDVMIEELLPELQSSLPPSLDASTLTGRLAQKRIELHKELKRHLKSEPTNHLILSLGEFIEVKKWREDAGRKHRDAAKMKAADFARQALEERWKASRKDASGIESLSIEERHTLRKTLKTMRYTAEFCQGLFDGKQADKFLASSKKLQTILGYLNDVTLAEQLLENLTSKHGTDPNDLAVVSYMVGWHTCRASQSWDTAIKQWQEFSATPRFWQEK
ncbi:CYTH and CHAD domain-containing protein [Rhodobacteraceae bacterium RKSG542]|uniref:CYTH and CHAD domain-containing protein n=1 Tax=Pseudovibrio flavus TaxID=2529854 RepID=UPI0012BD548B|nr:CYTH and CHAD domain-containing protein [Pseudovibrio flavus]MTI16875.1 CYTH and CHAD domain-containing protein [Pseudovibrio flavus]